MFKIKYHIFVWLSLGAILFLSACDNQPENSTEPVVTASGVGEVAPDFSAVNMNGDKVTLSQYRGKVVVLNFWATWCPPCREEMPSMEALHEAFVDEGLVMLAVNVEENGQDVVAEFLQKTPYSFPILLDEDAGIQNTYKVFRFPETFIIDKNGIIVEKIIGGRDWMRGATFKTIDFLLNG